MKYYICVIAKSVCKHAKNFMSNTSNELLPSQMNQRTFDQNKSP
jgi:hypothetical protein